MARLKTSIKFTKNYLLFFVLLFFLASFSLAFDIRRSEDFSAAKQEILLRNIGHQVLLFAGDSTSRVLPIQKTGDHQYHIKFEKQITFQPDSLVKIVNNVLSKDKSISNYIVNVLNCTKGDVVFGYAILGAEKDNITPCSGRLQPKGCYIIELKFSQPSFIAKQSNYILSGIPLLAIIGLLFVNQRKPKNKVLTEINVLKIGNTLFNPKNKLLIYLGTETELTSKENNLLKIFARRPNQIIERSTLQKEIWEDEGVIVGRSLDMFISKLRKKLAADESVELKNIHGKGYRLVC